jgi:2-amino-4-hydroxy-6-hydroxymethyldihydropteridine diphosphokinase
MSKVYCGLGSNKGDKLSFLFEAVELIEAHPDCEIIDTSSVYETAPMGESNQENYYNAAVEIETKLNIYEFHHLIKNIESRIGRTKTFRWGPREIDIDLLFFDDAVIKTDELTVPHKGITERDFVLVPLLEIAPEISMPGSGKKLKEFNIGLTNYYILSRVFGKLSEYQKIG